MEQIILVTGTPSGKLTSISCDTRCPYAAPCQATHGPVESRKGTRGSEGGRGGFTSLFHPSAHHLTTLEFHEQEEKKGGWYGSLHLHHSGRNAVC